MIEILADGAKLAHTVKLHLGFRPNSAARIWPSNATATTIEFGKISPPSHQISLFVRIDSGHKRKQDFGQ